MPGGVGRMPAEFTDNQVGRGSGVEAFAVDPVRALQRSHTAVANTGSEVWRPFRFVTTPVFAGELWGL